MISEYKIMYIYIYQKVHLIENGACNVPNSSQKYIMSFGNCIRDDNDEQIMSATLN